MEEDPNSLERLRADLIRRARIERHGEIDVQREPSFPSASRRPFLRLFRRGHPPPSARQAYPINIDIESPKSPEVSNGASTQPGGFQFPNFARPWTARSQSRRPHETLSEMNQYHRPLTTSFPSTTVPPPAHRRTLRERLTHMDGSESQASGNTSSSTHRRRLSGDVRYDASHRCSRHPKRFMLCLPWIHSKTIRKQVLTCFVTGLILILLVAVYLGLAMTKKVRTSEMTIMLILVILFATLFFFHGLIRLCITLWKESRLPNRPHLPNYGPRGYAVPPEPIPVVLAQDEEAAGVDSEATKINPPAYGLWRESVRVDPNRLFWQRNESASEVQLRQPSRAGPRPPSYASDDGVSYVMEATPRSTAPTMEVPLPIHPSEAGRVAQPSRSSTWQ